MAQSTWSPDPPQGLKVVTDVAHALPRPHHSSSTLALVPLARVTLCVFEESKE